MHPTGDATTKQMAPEASFTTSPPVGAGSSLRFLAWADSGQATAEDTNEYDYSEDYDPLMTSPAGTTDEAYWADYDVWQIEQVNLLCRIDLWLVGTVTWLMLSPAGATAHAWRTQGAS